MINQIVVAPPNSLFFISESLRSEAPEVTGVGLVWFNATCVVIGCLMYQDGETTVTVTSEGEPDDEINMRAFDGVIETPARELVISSCEHDVYLQVPVVSTRTRVRIWVNDTSEPDEIFVRLG